MDGEDQTLQSVGNRIAPECSGVQAPDRQVVHLFYILPAGTFPFLPADVLLPVLLVSFSIVSFRAIEAQSAGVLKQIGISEEEAREYIWSSFSGKDLAYPVTQEIRRLASGERPSVVRGVAQLAKRYSQGEEFKKKYLEFRESRKPAPPDPPKPMEQQRREHKADMLKVVKETEELSKSLPADQQSAMKEMVKMYKEQIKEIDNPGNPMFSRQAEEYSKQLYDMQMKEHNERVEKWKQDYPVSPSTMVQRWLTEFLEVSKDVDYNAKLVEGQYGRKVFARADYEAKSAYWKMCFRAGRETVEAGRAFAKEWLSELDKEK